GRARRAPMIIGARRACGSVGSADGEPASGEEQVGSGDHEGQTAHDHRRAVRSGAGELTATAAGRSATAALGAPARSRVGGRRRAVVTGGGGRRPTVIFGGGGRILTVLGGGRGLRRGGRRLGRRRGGRLGRG